MISWEQIISDEGSAVWKTLWRLLGDHTDVEDCFQETFLSAVTVAKREPVVNWSALLGRLATARAMDRLRQRYRPGGRLSSKRVSRNDSIEQPSSDAGPVEVAVATELSERLRIAVAELPEKQAEIFALHAIEGWTYAQLSEHMQMNEGAIRVTVHRARERLRESLCEH